MITLRATERFGKPAVFAACCVPLIWLLLHAPGGNAIAGRLPSKFRSMYDVSKQHGFDRKRLLDISTDTSEAGAVDYNPHSYFVTKQDLRRVAAKYLIPERSTLVVLSPDGQGSSQVAKAVRRPAPIVQKLKMSNGLSDSITCVGANRALKTAVVPGAI